MHVYPIIYRVLYIPGGDRRISEPSTGTSTPAAWRRSLDFVVPRYQALRSVENFHMEQGHLQSFISFF